LADLDDEVVDVDDDVADDDDDDNNGEDLDDDDGNGDGDDEEELDNADNGDDRDVDGDEDKAADEDGDEDEEKTDPKLAAIVEKLQNSQLQLTKNRVLEILAEAILKGIFAQYVVIPAIVRDFYTLSVDAQNKTAARLVPNVNSMWSSIQCGQKFIILGCITVAFLCMISRNVALVFIRK